MEYRKKFVDVHCHILEGVDDGSKSLDNSLEMARLAAEGGTSDIICTPHSIPGMFENYKGEELEEKFQVFKQALAENDIPLNVYLGMEVYGNENTPDDLKNDKLYSLAGSDYMLIEFNFGEDPRFVNYILDCLPDHGYIPVIAHPERYEFVADDPSLLFRWTDKGYLLQCNKDSIRGRFGKLPYRIARDVLSDNLYSFIGSDAHGALHRTPGLEYAFYDVEDLCGTEYAEKIFIDNPRVLLGGGEI